MAYLERNPPANLAATTELDVSRFMSKVYGWMMLGIFVTSIVSYHISNTPSIVYALVENKLLFFGLFIVQLGAVFVLAGMIEKLSYAASVAIYLVYSALTGLTFSVICLAYTSESIMSAFFTTAVAFGGLSAFGYLTKRDLGPIGSFCMMGLFGLIAIMLLSIFIPSLMGDTAQKVISVIGIIVFAGLTAYDTQKIKTMRLAGGPDALISKRAISGALILYLDFINLFLSILRLTGDRR